MKDQGERVVVDPREAIADAITLSERRSLLTPIRAALLIVGTIVGGAALSLILGTAPAHAADGDGAPAPDGGLLGGTTSLVSTATATTAATTRDVATAATTTVSGLDTVAQTTTAATVATVLPPVQTLVRATGDTLTDVAPIAAPLIQPVVNAVSGTVTAAVQQFGPVHEVLWGMAAASAPNGPVAPGAPASAIVAAAASGTAASLVTLTLVGSADGTVPTLILTSSSGGPVAAIGALFLVFALAMLAKRRRVDDDTLPPSPVFETDTSPA